MDSLAANYASSSDEDEPRNPNPNPNHNPRPPKPFFSSLPPPKPTTTTSSSTFSSIPAPKPKKIVRFTPPINPSLLNPDDDDDEDERKKRKPVFDSSSKPLSSIIPPPKNTFGLAPVGSSFSSRRSIVEADVPVKAAVEERSDVGGYEGYGGDWTGGSALVDASIGWGADGGGYYESYGGNLEYEGSVSYAPAELVAAPTIDVGRICGKRGRNEIPVNIVEVKQDELVKDRPREDQVKLTGIAFGPAYQPISSQKGKPSKLHKRKHQIGSLYFDMKQKEMELAERRSRGMLTKKETQGKYGW